MTGQKINPWLPVVVFVAFLTVGCRGNVADNLQGRWIGKPDTAAELASREAKRYHDPSRAATQHTDSKETPNTATADITDWEQYDVHILLNFVDDQRLEMSLTDGAQPLSGNWHIVQSSMTSLLIEVETKTMAASGENGKPGESEWRRFDLQLDYEDDRCIGFRMNESGADPRLGSIYFTREE